MPRIQRIEIESFRGIRERLTLDLVGPDGKPVSQFVLAGPNGCGKTSVLEAVLLALGRGDLIVRDLGSSERTDHWRKTIPEGARIKVVMIDHGQQVSIDLTASSAPPRFIDGVEYFSSWRSPALVGPVQPLGRGRRPADTESNRLWRLKQRIVDARAKTAFGTARHDEGVEWLQVVNRAWRRLHEGQNTAVVVDLVAPTSPDAYADLFVEKDGRRVCPIDQVSSGEIELLSFAGWIALTEVTEGILLIDEPELHLHPEWQASILPALRELAPSMQFLVATHADAPWSRAMSWERALLVAADDPRALARRRSSETSTSP